MINIVQADGAAERAVLEAMRARAARAGAAVDKAAAEIMEAVRERGFEAVREYSLRFDGAEPRELDPAELEAARSRCPAALIAALEHAAANIRDYNEKLLTRTQEWTSPDGGLVGRVVRGLARVGIYVPGGTARYPSSVLMDAIPAKIAGVETIVMATPPGPDGKVPAPILVAAKLAGVRTVVRAGGAQAIAALAFGTQTVPRVDKIVGPGNIYVATAKQLCYARGLCDIDMVAGPSEIMIVSDANTNPVHLAADLLSQAEHDRLSSAWLAVTDASLARKVAAEVERQLKLLPREEIARTSIEQNGRILVVDSLETAARLADEIAPEHLELCVDDPFGLLPMVHNAGSVFLGRSCPEPLGDYLAGPNHTLPTSGTARYSSPLGVDDFCRRSSYLYYTPDALGQVSEDVMRFARREGLDAHANAVAVRMEGRS